MSTFPRRLYIAATSQHVGKTTTTLGLVNVLRESGLSVGYCKPVGQRFVDFHEGRADKDAGLFAQVMDFDLEPNIHSPVILGPGATTAYLDDPGAFNFPNLILKSSKILEQRYDVVVYEGTGHPGVGSIADLSNADVAKMLGASLVMVVEAGIGNTLDRLALSFSLFEQAEVPIAGVIINKALPEKMAKVEKYVGMKLRQKKIPLLGVIPFEETLGLPLMRTIVRAIGGKVEMNEDRLDNRVEDTIAGSLIDLRELKNFRNLLLVVSIRRLDDALNKLNRVCHLLGEEGSPLSGLIVTGDGDITARQESYLNEFKIPLVRSKLDTYESIIKIARIEVKINPKTPWKVTRAVELFRKHVDMNKFLL